MDQGEALKLLREGKIEEWNQRRASGEGIPPLGEVILRGADLTKANLTGADLSGTKLTAANLSRADLHGAKLTATDLSEANLSGADLGKAQLHGAYLTKAELSGADLTRADLTGAYLTGVHASEPIPFKTEHKETKFIVVDLTKAFLGGASLPRVNFTGTNFTEADLGGANLRGANLHGTDLTSTDLTGADLNCADLRGADLTGATLLRAILLGADLGGAKLNETDITEAQLNKANLVGAQLIRVVLNGADLSEAKMGDTCLCSLELSDVRGLNFVQHVGPTHVSTDTLALSKGRLPDSFLKGCGLAPWEILNCQLYDPFLTPDQIAELPYKVFDKRAHGPLFIGGIFISYSWKDMKFADKLYARLIKEEARVWLDRHEMVAGPMQKQVHRAIRLNDVVLLILSESSRE